MSKIDDILERHGDFAKIIRNPRPFRRLDFSENNKALAERELLETSHFSDFIFYEMLSGRNYTGIGGYDENRIIYRHRKHFGGADQEARCIHLGTDIWSDAGEAIFCPLDARVHSFAFNNHYGDYGPTIILEHELEGVRFFTLYGHLALASLGGLSEGKVIHAGQQFARIGPYPENGDWPPHLHFQVISEIGHFKGDFPGVSSLANRAYYLDICPDPNLILRIPENRK